MDLVILFSCRLSVFVFVAFLKLLRKLKAVSTLNCNGMKGICTFHENKIRELAFNFSSFFQMKTSIGFPLDWSCSVFASFKKFHLKTRKFRNKKFAFALKSFSFCIFWDLFQLFLLDFRKFWRKYRSTRLTLRILQKQQTINQETCLMNFKMSCYRKTWTMVAVAGMVQ